MESSATAKLIDKSFKQRRKLIGPCLGPALEPSVDAARQRAMKIVEGDVTGPRKMYHGYTMIERIGVPFYQSETLESRRLSANGRQTPSHLLGHDSEPAGANPIDGKQNREQEWIEI